MMAPSPRSSAMPCTYCSEPQVSTDRAVACALALDDYAQSFRERCRKKAIALGATRIGAHAGPAIVGNFGGTGDAVSNFSFIMRLAPPALHVAHKIWRDEITDQRAPPR